MTASTSTSSGGASRQPWSPEHVPSGVTCPACGLANEAGARVCRNCGLPVARAEDPVRGVAPGRVEMPSTKRSGLSATVGLGLVVGLLVVGGSLAVSGGGILSSGGRLGVEAGQSAAPLTAEEDDNDVVPALDEGSDGPATGGEPVVAVGTKTDFACEDAAITDLSRRKWQLNRFVAGSRIDEGYDQVTFELSRDGQAKTKTGTDVQLEWMSPSQARSAYGAPDRVQGSRALVLTFDGPVGVTVNQALDSLLLEREDVEQIRNIQMFEGTDGRVHAAIGLRSESCARVEAKGWNKKAKAKAAKVLLQVERFDT